jgi:hypothetical protein
MESKEGVIMRQTAYLRKITHKKRATGAGICSPKVTSPLCQGMEQ